MKDKYITVTVHNGFYTEPVKAYCIKVNENKKSKKKGEKRK